MQALQSLVQQPCISKLVAEQNELGGQSVFFSNPRGKKTLKKELEKLCKDAGMHLVGVSINHYDMKNLDARQHVVNEGITLGAKYSLMGVGSASGFKALEKAVSLGSAATTTLAAIGIGAAGYVIGKDVLSKNSGYARNIKSAVGNTWGNGNKQWAA